MDISTFQANYIDQINLKDFIFNIGFCIGVIKFIFLGTYSNYQDSVLLFSAVSYGVLNGIRVILIAALMPSPLRFIVPIIDALCFILRIFHTKKICKKKHTDLEIRAPLDHIHIE